MRRSRLTSDAIELASEEESRAFQALTLASRPSAVPQTRPRPSDWLPHPDLASRSWGAQALLRPNFLTFSCSHLPCWASLGLPLASECPVPIQRLGLSHRTRSRLPRCKVENRPSRSRRQTHEIFVFCSFLCQYCTKKSPEWLKMTLRPRAIGFSRAIICPMSIKGAVFLSSKPSPSFHARLFIIWTHFPSEFLRSECTVGFLVEK